MSDTSVDVYWLPYCTTCQKAVAHLEAKGVPVRSYRNLKEQPLSEDEVRALAAKVGGVDRLFSKRAMKYRAMGLHERGLSEDDLVRLMAEEYTFVTRPVIVRGESATAGFSAKKLDALLA
ncbi:arsenate reductase [bacterium JGI 053]|nr:arsenate reductase [bacterium JGI 053]